MRGRHGVARQALNGVPRHAAEQRVDEVGMKQRFEGMQRHDRVVVIRPILAAAVDTESRCQSASPRPVARNTSQARCTRAGLARSILCAVSGSRPATSPANQALLPPGPYMLTVLDDMGVPSVAHWINIR